MIWLKASLFICTVLNVKYIFTLINNYGDNKVENMKELISFTEYLRVYSCEMKMSIEEIYGKYNFKNNSTNLIAKEMIRVLKEKKEYNEFLVYINKIMYTTRDFNSCFAAIIDYYGNTYSDVLDKKLKFTIDEMTKAMNEFSLRHNEKKTLYNKISFLAGCLAAIILI